MQYLKEKEWILFNELTHMIHDTRDLDEMRVNLLDLISVLIPYSSSSFYLAAGQSDKLLSDPVTNNIDSRDVSNYLAYGEGLDYTIPIFKNARPFAYKETDLFEDTTREKSEFYNEFLAHGLEYPLALCISHSGKCYGALSLYRSKRMGDFSDRDVFILNQLHDHLATRIYLEESRGAFRVVQKIGESHAAALTAREQEIVSLMLQGLSNEEISCRLFVEIGTVKKHIYNIYCKFHVKNRMQLLKELL